MFTKKLITLLATVLFAFIYCVSEINAQALKVGSVVNLQNQYPTENGYLDTRGRVTDKSQFRTATTETTFVSTNTNPNRDNGSGSWKIVSATGKADGSPLLYGDKIHLMNMYPGAGYLDSWGYVKDMPAFAGYAPGSKIGVFTTQSKNRDNGSGTWIVKSASSKADGTPVNEGDNIHLQNGYPNSGYLDINGSVTENPAFKEYAGSSSLVFISESSNRFKNSGTWKITNSGSSNKAETPGKQQSTTATATKFPITAGSALQKNIKYVSPSGNYYLILQPDGNMAIFTKTDGYIWGLDKLKKNSADRVEVSGDGNLIAYDRQGKMLWSPQTRRDPSAMLTMNFNGALQLVAGNGEILWSSDGNLSQSINVFMIKPNAKSCTPEAGWAKCIELANPSIQIIGTSAVTQSAMNAVANVYSEIISRLDPKYPKDKLNGFKVYMTNGESWSQLKPLTAISTNYPEQPYDKSADFLRGFGGGEKVWITEQMICKQGVKTRNATGKILDNSPRTFDQVIHEFGHSLDFLYAPDQFVNGFRFLNMTSLESFPWRIQQWFGSPGDDIPANQEALLKQLFTSRATFSCEGYRP